MQLVYQITVEIFTSKRRDSHTHYDSYILTINHNFPQLNGMQILVLIFNGASEMNAR